MIRWAGKLAVVTGASSGIGAAIVKELAKQGVNVVGIARRDDRIKALADELKNEKGKVYAVKCDLTKDSEVVEAFKWIEGNLKAPVHILVNNAGLSILRDTIDGKTDEWRKMFDVNVIAAGSCIREQLSSMKAHNIDDGHIINVCSIVSHRLIEFPGFFVYSATKHAMKVITEAVRRELLKAKSHTRVTSISPGYVATELFETAGEYSPDSVSALGSFAHLQPDDIANAVCYAISLPQHVRVCELTIQATEDVL